MLQARYPAATAPRSGRCAATGGAWRCNPCPLPAAHPPSWLAGKQASSSRFPARGCWDVGGLGNRCPAASRQSESRIAAPSVIGYKTVKHVRWCTGFCLPKKFV